MLWYNILHVSYSSQSTSNKKHVLFVLSRNTSSKHYRASVKTIPLWKYCIEHITLQCVFTLSRPSGDCKLNLDSSNQRTRHHCSCPLNVISSKQKTCSSTMCQKSGAYTWVIQKTSSRSIFPPSLSSSIISGDGILLTSLTALYWNRF